MSFTAGELYAGVPVHDAGEIRQHARILGVDLSAVSDDDVYDRDCPWPDPIEFTWQGEHYSLAVELAFAQEDCEPLPVPRSDLRPGWLMGVALTSVYAQADSDLIHVPLVRGMSPYVFEIQDLQEVLLHVQARWPEARLMILDNFN